MLRSGLIIVAKQQAYSVPMVGFVKDSGRQRPPGALVPTAQSAGMAELQVSHRRCLLLLLVQLQLLR